MNAICSNMDGPGDYQIESIATQKVGIGALEQNKLNYREIVTWVKEYKLQSTLSYFKWPLLPNVLSTPMSNRMSSLTHREISKVT